MFGFGKKKTLDKKACYITNCDTGKVEKHYSDWYYPATNNTNNHQKQRDGGTIPISGNTDYVSVTYSIGGLKDGVSYRGEAEVRIYDYSQRKYRDQLYKLVKTQKTRYIGSDGIGITLRNYFMSYRVSDYGYFFPGKYRVECKIGGGDTMKVDIEIESARYGYIE